MSDRIPARILIGGPIPASLATDLAQAITEEQAFLNYDEPAFSPKTEADLLGAVRDGHLALVNPEASWGLFNTLERFLCTHRIAFDRYTEGKYEYNAEIVQFRPGMRHPESFLATQDAKIVVPVSEIIAALRRLERGSIKAAIRQLKKAIGKQIPPLEPLSFTA
jgi:hypothetical protein